MSLIQANTPVLTETRAHKVLLTTLNMMNRSVLTADQWNSILEATGLSEEDLLQNFFNPINVAVQYEAFQSRHVYYDLRLLTPPGAPRLKDNLNNVMLVQLGSMKAPLTIRRADHTIIEKIIVQKFPQIKKDHNDAYHKGNAFVDPASISSEDPNLQLNANLALILDVNIHEPELRLLNTIDRLCARGFASIEKYSPEQVTSGFMPAVRPKKEESRIKQDPYIYNDPDTRTLESGWLNVAASLYHHSVAMGDRTSKKKFQWDAAVYVHDGSLNADGSLNESMSCFKLDANGWRQFLYPTAPIEGTSWAKSCFVRVAPTKFSSKKAGRFTTVLELFSIYIFPHVVTSNIDAASSTLTTCNESDFAIMMGGMFGDSTTPAIEAAPATNTDVTQEVAGKTSADDVQTIPLEFDLEKQMMDVVDEAEKNAKKRDRTEDEVPDAEVTSATEESNKRVLTEGDAEAQV